MFPYENMRFSGLSEELLASQTSVRVLRELLLFPAKEATGRQLAKDARTPLARTIEALNVLERHGLVGMTEVGRSQLWRVRREHAISVHLRPWFEFERQVLDALIREIAKVLSPLPAVRRAAIFGSVARGHERPDSDIDLFVLIDDATNQEGLESLLRPLQERIRATFGNPLRWVIYDQAQLEKNKTRPFYRNVERDGLLVLERPMVQTERIDKARASAYWTKAQDFHRTSERAAEAGDWNGAALAAIHAVISAGDALTAFHLQVRSKDPDHEEVTKLLSGLPLPEAREKANLVLEVLDQKNVVAYEARPLNPKSVAALIKKATRFLRWAAANLPRPGS